LSCRDAAAPDVAVRPVATADDALTLAAVRGVGPQRFQEFMATFGTPAAALSSLPMPRVRSAQALAASWRERARAASIEWTPSLSADYPERLRRLEDPPSVLWWAGAPALLRAPTVAIVGTRRASADGRRVAWLLAERAVQLGACVVSGLAVGIDAAAHEGALHSGGATIAVTGTGVDVPYPAEHAALLDTIRARGLVLSEAPPGGRASVGVFPRRNRIIAALADLVIVVEAGHRSGALNTAQHAVTLAVPIAAVPGSITTPQNAGSNALLRDGAPVIASLDDLDVLLSMARVRSAGERSAPTVTPSAPPSVPAPLRRPRRSGQASTWPTDVSPPAQQVLALIARTPDVLDEVVLRSGLTTARALAAVSELEMAALVSVGLDGVVRTAAQARRA
jgi:DNA processing protein